MTPTQEASALVDFLRQSSSPSMHRAADLIESQAAEISRLLALLPASSMGEGIERVSLRSTDPHADGWVMVPREPTEAMLIAAMHGAVEADEPVYQRMMEAGAHDAALSARIALGDSRVHKASYRAMIAAAPASAPLDGEKQS